VPSPQQLEAPAVHRAIYRRQVITSSKDSSPPS
jgi:hypothetical protein